MIDGGIERLGRRLAARTTRRTFLDRAAKVAVLVAGGPALATLLAERAEARVCGQSGVSPKCPTFDCEYPDSVWGWCWYASGNVCCAGGGLKKICDCCTRDWPNVHGYCPSGTNVRCIVESCAADPRVMQAPVFRATGLGAVAVSHAHSRLFPAGGGGTVVVADADALFAAVAGPLAAWLDVPLLLTGRDRLASGVLAEVQRLDAERAILVGPLPDRHADELEGYGVTVERLGNSADPAVASEAVTLRFSARRRPLRVVCIERTGQSAAAATVAAVHAGALGWPLVVGFDTARRLTDEGQVVATLLVGPEAARRAGELSGGFPTRSATRDELAAELATLTTRVHRRGGVTVNVVPAASPDVSPGLAGSGGVLLYHPDGELGPVAQGWIIAHQAHVGRGITAGSFGALNDHGVWLFQSALNRFDVHLLQGTDGQGLPVISQPTEEREIGRARVAGQPEPDGSSYWTARARR